MDNLHVNRKVYDAVQSSLQSGVTQGGRPKIDAAEVDRIEAAITEDGDVSRDEQLLLDSLRSHSSFHLVSGSEASDIDPLEVSFPSRTDVSDTRALEQTAIQKLGPTQAIGDRSPEKLIADTQSVFDAAAQALDSGKSEDAAQLLTQAAESLRKSIPGAGNPEKGILQELAHNMDARASAYRQTDPDSARGAAGSLALYARNADVIADGLVTSHPEYSQLMRSVANDSRFQAQLIDQTAANTKSMLGLAVSKTYRNIVDASFAHDIAGSGSINNFFTGNRDQLEADRVKMTEVFDYIDQKMQTEGLNFHEAWSAMFDDHVMASRSVLPHFATAHEAATFLRDHEVSRGLLMPMSDFSEGLASGDPGKVDQARGKLVEALRDNDQWDLAKQVLSDFKAHAGTEAGQQEASRLSDNESREWWKAKAVQFATEDLPVMLLAGVVSGGVGLGAEALGTAAGLGTNAVRLAKLSTEIAAFVPTERILSDTLNNRRSDWSAGALARDYALTLGGVALGKALGAGWRALRGVKPVASELHLTPGSEIHTVDPRDVCFSQNTVSFNKVDRATGAKYTYDDLVSSMSRDGWKGDPVDVVAMPDGVGTAMDNTRILAAREAGISAQVRVRSFDEVLTAAEQGRFKIEGKPLPKTWGEAIQLRIQNQKGFYSGSTFGDIFPNGTLYDPKVTGRR